MQDANTGLNSQRMSLRRGVIVAPRSQVLRTSTSCSSEHSQKIILIGSIIAILFIFLFSTVAFAASGDDWQVRENTAKVYEAPDTNASVSATLKQGDRLKELRRQGSWVKVLIFGKIGAEGWVKESDIQPWQQLGGTSDGGAADETVESAAPARAEPRYILSLSVSGPRQRFQAQCTSLLPNGTRREARYRGTAPAAIAIRASAVHCRVFRSTQPTGTLFVKLFERGGSKPVGANSTSAANGCVGVRSRGPWGRNFGRLCTSAGPS